ncbi:MAG: type II secretion system F family protein [Candidatus Omnitrophica bacterium]|nr:type II secretion system F family protein [Candidatus Omnitrophota bacterium]
MIVYQYTAKDKDGHTVMGTLEGASEQEVMQSLHNKGLIIISIEPAKKRQQSVFSKEKKVKADDLVIFTRQLATMVDAGIPLVHVLGILAEQIEKKGLRGVVSVVRQDIEAGMSFTNALSKHPVVFSDLFINMVRAGETSGMLAEVLDRLAAYMEKSASLARKIRSSLIYPAVVVSMAIIITAFLLIRVVPTFKGIFDILGGNLPFPTQVLIAVSNLFRKYFLLLAGFLIIGGFLLKKYISTERGRYNFDNQKLKMPVLGMLFRKVAVAKFSRTFSTLVKSGVSVLNALEIVSRTSGNKVVEEAVLNCSKSVRDGEPISRPLAKSGVFPPMVCRMISVGEQTGQLEKMLTKIADFYDEQVDVAAAGLTSLIEPLVIAFLGIVIGGIVVALFLPIFKLTELLGR